jgi:hypothetical protein
MGICGLFLPFWSWFSLSVGRFAVVGLMFFFHFFKREFAVLRIRDVYPGSDFFHPGSEFFHPGSASKNLSILTQKNGF